MKKTFKYKLTPILWTLFIAGLILAAGCVYLNVVRFINLKGENDSGIYNYIGSILSAVVGILAFVFIPPAMFSSKYVVTDDRLFSYWGLVKNTFEIKEITTVTHFRKSDKMAIYFSDQSYIAINIDPKEFDDFANALKSVNKNVFYQLNTEDSGAK